MPGLLEISVMVSFLIPALYSVLADVGLTRSPPADKENTVRT